MYHKLPSGHFDDRVSEKWEHPTFQMHALLLASLWTIADELVLNLLCNAICIGKRIVILNLPLFFYRPDFLIFFWALIRCRLTMSLWAMSLADLVANMNVAIFAHHGFLGMFWGTDVEHPVGISRLYITSYTLETYEPNDFLRKARQLSRNVTVKKPMNVRYKDNIFFLLRGLQGINTIHNLFVREGRVPKNCQKDGYT
ncbi:hypothetical protein IW261DRAFT_1461314 [Armillaria novae-zelandiae]|uniref:Uncharacterized protein n=1 Tax=Armillaria novae-zelandiae TaxID=153914 RepID=A0AA39PJ23_9AGAR|nr:hypothetical protein IW261DRAFT_1461314 [Armillaria novae-zelandiae]